MPLSQTHKFKKVSAVMLLAIAALFVMAGCITDSETSPVEGTLTIPNSLGFGSSDDGGMVVQFTSVENDSRCPADVTCVRAGEAFVRLKVTVGQAVPQDYSLEMVPGGQESVDIGDYIITVLELRPDPPPAGGLSQDQYEILVRIEETD